MSHELILHVGMHKTGSSSIQDSFARAPVPGLHYLDLKVPNHSGPLRQAFFEPKSAIYGIGDNPARIAAVTRHGAWLAQHLLTQLARPPQPRSMISAEDLSQLEMEEALRRLLDVAGPHVTAVRALAYVRPPRALLPSIFQTAVQMAIDQKTREYCFQARRIDMLRRVLGADRLEVAKFARQALIGGDPVLDCAARLGLDLDPAMVVRSNTSLGIEAIAVLYCHNLFGRAGLGDDLVPAQRQALVALIAPLGQRSFRFGAAELKRLMPDLAEEEARLAARVGQPMDDPAEGEVEIDSQEMILRIAAEVEPELRALVQAACDRHLWAEPMMQRGLAAANATVQAPRRIARLVEILARILARNAATGPGR